MSLSPEHVGLLEHAARHPAGATPLLEGHLESVAALYQLHPFAVDALRTHLETPAARKAALELIARLEARQ